MSHFSASVPKHTEWFADPVPCLQFFERSASASLVITVRPLDPPCATPVSLSSP